MKERERESQIKRKNIFLSDSFALNSRQGRLKKRSIGVKSLHEDIKSFSVRYQLSREILITHYPYEFGEPCTNNYLPPFPL